MWQLRYNELVKFWEKHGHSSVPQRYKQNQALGKWVHKQRQQMKKKYNCEPTTLTPYRVAALERIEFQVDPKNRSHGSWLKRYKELETFKKCYGHCKVPQKYPLNKSLGRWVHKQRHDLMKELYSEKTPLLIKQRIDALEKIGFEWSSRRKQSDTILNACPSLNEVLSSDVIL